MSRRSGLSLCLRASWSIIVLLGAVLGAGNAASDPVGVPPGTSGGAGGPMDLQRSPGSAVRVPITLVHEKTIVPVHFPGGRNLHLILDTGMGFDGLLLFKPDLKDSLGEREFLPAVIPGAGGGAPSEAMFADSLSFHVGDAYFEHQRVIILANDALAGPEIDGVIGYSLLGHYAVSLDFDAMEATLLDAEAGVPESGWTSLPLEFGRNNLPFLELSVAVRDERPVTLKAYLDCASSEAVELLEQPGQKFIIPADAAEAHLGTGLSGDIRGRRGRIARLLLGPYELRDVPAAFVAKATRSKAGVADAVLANAALRRFNLVYDYARSRLLIRPNRRFEERFR